jgi:hypothetical protein
LEPVEVTIQKIQKITDFLTKHTKDLKHLEPVDVTFNQPTWAEIAVA